MNLQLPVGHDRLHIKDETETRNAQKYNSRKNKMVRDTGL